MGAGPYCPGCGNILVPASTFCHVCGRRVDDHAAPVSNDGAADGSLTDADTQPVSDIPRAPAVPAWRWTMLAVNCALLCVCLGLAAWSWRDPPRHHQPPAAPAPATAPALMPTDAAGPVVTVPAGKPRPTPTRAGAGVGAPQPTPTPTPLPTATATPAATATPMPSPTPATTPPGEY